MSDMGVLCLPMTLLQVSREKWVNRSCLCFYTACSDVYAKILRVTTDILMCIWYVLELMAETLMVELIIEIP